MLDPRLLKALLVAGAPLRLAIAANIWAGRSLRCASAGCVAPCAAACTDPYLQAQLPPGCFAFHPTCWRPAPTRPRPLPTWGAWCRAIAAELAACPPAVSFDPTQTLPPNRYRAVAAELARRLFELVGWLSGRVSERRLRGFERAYFALRRWHVLAGAWNGGWADLPGIVVAALDAAVPLAGARVGVQPALPALLPLPCRRRPADPHAGARLAAVPCASTCPPSNHPTNALFMPACSCRRRAAGWQAGAVGIAVVGRVCLRSAAAEEGAPDAHGDGGELQGVGAGGAGGAPC